MKVLAICSYPNESAATRYRLGQFVEPLRERGIDLTVSPFLDSRSFAALYRSGSSFSKLGAVVGGFAKRIAETAKAGRFDALLIQREAAIVGPALFERLFRVLGRLPTALDLDDATYVRYTSPTYGKIGSAFKFFGKTDRLIDMSDVVICGNRFIADYAAARGRRTEVIPTVVDTEIFRPVERTNPVPVIGWVGTHSTFPFVESIFPILSRLSREFDFEVRIVGAGRPDISIDGVRVSNLEWDLNREIADFQGIDIGLYPIRPGGSAPPEWIKGKSGFKAIQYMAVGAPFVMSPVGVCAEIGEPGATHYNASGDDEWYNSLRSLLNDAGHRQKMGENARRFSLSHFGLEEHADKLAATLKSIRQNNGNS